MSDHPVPEVPAFDLAAALFQVTPRRNIVGVLTAGTAVLGLGDIGPIAALPVCPAAAVVDRRLESLRVVSSGAGAAGAGVSGGSVPGLFRVLSTRAPVGSPRR